MNAYAPLDCPTSQLRTEFQIVSTPATTPPPPLPSPRLTLFLTMNAEKFRNFIGTVFCLLGAFLSQFVIISQFGSQEFAPLSTDSIFVKVCLLKGQCKYDVRILIIILSGPYH